MTKENKRIAPYSKANEIRNNLLISIKTQMKSSQIFNKNNFSKENNKPLSEIASNEQTYSNFFTSLQICYISDARKTEASQKYSPLFPLSMGSSVVSFKSNSYKSSEKTTFHLKEETNFYWYE